MRDLTEILRPAATIVAGVRHLGSPGLAQDQPTETTMKKHYSGFRGAFARALVLFIAVTIAAAPSSLNAALTFFTTSPSLVMEAIDFDPATGDLYYLRTDNDFATATPQNSTLVRRTAASGFTDPTVVFDFGARKFGSFVTLRDGRAYFGESSDGTIRSVALDGSDAQVHATVAGNFDLVFSPGGDAFVSANGGGFGQTNEVLQLDLGTGTTQAVVGNTNDFSGPIDFDADGNLYYGATGSPFGIGTPTDLYQFTPAEIANALAGSAIDLGTATPFLTTPGQSQLEFVEGEGLYRHVFGGLTLVDTGAASDAPVEGEPGPSFGPIAHDGQNLYGVTTDFGTSVSSFVLIPEPARAALIAIGLVPAIFARRRRS